MLFLEKVADILADTMAENKLHATTIRNAGPGLLGDGGGLYLKKQSGGVGQWHYRYSFAGSRVEMGLGGWPAVSLSEARDLRNGYRTFLKTARKDPRGERDRQKREAEIARGSTLSQIINDKFEATKAGLKGDANASRWRSPLDLHVSPALGHVPIADITQHDIAAVLKPIWKSKAVTARKCVNRLALAFDHAEAQGHPVSRQTVRAARNLLGEQGHKETNIPAMPWAEVPTFYQSLGESPVELALRLLILTAVRSRPVRFARSDQIDGKVWRIPAEQVKGRAGQTEEFEVPLSMEAQRVVQAAIAFSRDGFLFPGQRRGVISDMSLSGYMKRRQLSARPHGFRSSFRTWAGEATEAPREIAEACLGHAVGSAVERAYQRGALLDRRRVVMDRWAGFVAGETASEVAIHG